MYIRHHALQDLSVSNGQVLTDGGVPFDRVAYSRFKYGYALPAVGYGRGLAELIGPDLFDLAGSEPVRVVSAPYKHLPTASQVIAEALVGELARMSVLTHQIEPPKLVPFYKSRVGSGSYAKSSEADRLRSLATLGLRIDASQIEGAHVLIVDDIRITGSAERATAGFMETLNPRGVWYLHAARLPEQVGKLHPGLEDELNQTVGHTARDILRDIATGDFRLNTRVLRHILEYSESEFNLFTSSAPDTILRQMLYAALGNGVSYVRTHAAHVGLLSEEIDRREGKLAYAGT